MRDKSQRKKDKTLASRLKINFFECSARTGEEISEIFIQSIQFYKYGNVESQINSFGISTNKIKIWQLKKKKKRR